MAITIDLSENKKFGNKKINLKGATTNEYIEFTNGLKNQVEYAKSGGNIVIKVYAQKVYDYKRIVTNTEKSKVGIGPNKNKYQQFYTVYKATFKSDGSFNKWVLAENKVKYVKSKGTGEDVITYQTILNGKVIAKSKTLPDFQTHTSLDTSKLLGKYTITNVGQQTNSSIDVYLTSADYDDKSLLRTEWELTPKKNKFNGSNLNEKATSTDKNETFDMKGGFDEIFFKNNKNIGNDTVKLGKNSNTNLSFNKSSSLNYIKDKNNVIITSGNGGQVTLKNYFNYADATVTVNSTNLVNTLNKISAFTNIGNKDLNKSQTIKGTFLQETFFGGHSADKIYTGDGDDSITGNEGNDKIYITGKGTKKINIGSGDGTDTIYDCHKATAINIILKDTSKAEDVEYIKSGNDLYVKSYKGDDYCCSVVLKNWFKKGCKLSVSYGSSTVSDVESSLKSGSIKLYFAPAKSITGTDYADEINTGYNTKSIDAKNGINTININSKNSQKITVKAGKNNDTYNINNPYSTTVINDAGGSDTIIVSGLTKNNTVMFFNVDKKGNVDTTLHLLDKANNGSTTLAKTHKLQDTVTIQNYLAANKTQGTGYIETIKAGNNTCSVNLGAIASQVSSWLSSGGRNYDSAMAVINSKNSTDINALLQMYLAK